MRALVRLMVKPTNVIINIILVLVIRGQRWLPCAVTVNAQNMAWKDIQEMLCQP